MRILTGEELKDYIENRSLIKNNKYCHILAKEFIYNLNKKEYIKLPYLLSGDRGNGKTTLLESCIKLIGNYGQTAYITLEQQTLGSKYKNDYGLYFNELMGQLNVLKDIGIKNVFIDEITILKDYYYYGNNHLPDFLAYHFDEGLKIITGTNSLILAETVNSNDNSRVRYITRYLPRIYTYSDFMKVNPNKSIKDYLQNGGLLRPIDFQKPLTYLPYFISQKNLLLESVIYRLYRENKLQLSYSFRDTEEFYKKHLAILLYIFLTEILFQEKSWIDYSKLKRNCEKFNKTYENSIYELFRIYCSKIGELGTFSNILGDFALRQNKINLLHSSNRKEREEVENEFLFNYILDEILYNIINLTYFEPFLDDFVYELRNLVDNKPNRLYKPILKGLKLEQFFIKTLTKNTKKIAHLTGQYFETIVIELEKVLLKNKDIPHNLNLYTLTDYNTFEIDLVNTATKELVEIKYRDNYSDNLSNYAKHLIKDKELEYYEQTSRVKDLTSYNKVVVYTGESFTDENGISFQNFTDRYKHLDVLVPWSYQLPEQEDEEEISVSVGLNW